MSAVKNLAFGINTTPLNIHLAVVTEAVGALRFPINGSKLPPTVNLVLLTSFFSGFTSQQILPYVTVLLDGTKLFLMNIIVFVPLMSLVPCASYPISFVKDRIQSSLSGPFRRCLYSWATPVSGWITAFASIVVKTSVARAYCGEVPPVNLDRRFFLGPSFTLGGGVVFTLGGDWGLSGVIMSVPVCTLYVIVGSSPSSSSIILGFDCGTLFIIGVGRGIF